MDVGETGLVGTLFTFSQISPKIFTIEISNCHDKDRWGILPLQTLLINYVVTSFVATDYGVNDTWSNCPNLPRHGGRWGQYTGYIGIVLKS